VKGSRPLRRLVGRANGTKLDIAECDSSVGLLRLDITGLARGSRAGTTSSADLVGANGVCRVEPEHVGSVVVPDTENESHTGIEILAKAGKTALLGERVGVTSGGLLLLAELVGDLVGLCDAGDVGVGLLDDFAVLNVDAADGAQSTGCGVVRGTVMDWSARYNPRFIIWIAYMNWVTTVILDLESTVLPGPKKFGAPNL
jgi:hypothetical protein